MKPSIFSQFEFLRAHVESVEDRPAVIMVTSAKSCDGKSLTAHGLAERLADTGRHVVLAEYRPATAMQALLDADPQMRRGFSVVTLSPGHEDSTIATPALRATIEELRANYDYTIIDAAPLLQSRVAILLASMVDAVLVTVRLGRPSGGADAALVQSLRRAGTKVLGVVAASARDIAAFAKAREANYADVITPMLPGAPEFPSRDHGAFPALLEGRHR